MLLCGLCPSANEFLAILFLFQRLRRTLRRNFNWIRQQMKIVPIDSHCKNSPAFGNVITFPKAGDFFQWGFTGKFFTRCLIWMTFCTGVRQKPSNHGCEFELDRARSKINIAKNSFALGHETHNRLNPHL